MPLDLASITPTRPQLAALFRTSTRWIGELRSAGTLPPDGATLADNVAAWARYRAGERHHKGDDR